MTLHAQLDRYIVISADTHGGTPAAGYRSYVDPKFRDDFDRWLQGHQEGIERFRESLSASFRAKRTLEHEEELQLFWDKQKIGIGTAAERLKIQEEDGVVAGVVYPVAAPETVQPFGFGFGGGKEWSRELVWAGARAYNRWLADYCAEAPHRLFGIAVIPDLLDLDQAIEEVNWAAGSGSLRGGVTFSVDHRTAPLNDRRYDPFWGALEANRQAVNMHFGFGRFHDPHLHGEGPDSSYMATFDAEWQGYRPLAQLIIGGAFERFPGLHAIFTEQSADWVPGHLKRITEALAAYQYNPRGAHKLSLTPHEYWRRNCGIGASFMAPKEARMREEIGVETIMYGTDFPHPEGTYPHTVAHLRRTFEGVPSDEVQMILSENAARLYGFDLEALAPIAARVGPPHAEVAAPLDQKPDHFHIFSNRNERDYD